MTPGKYASQYNVEDILLTFDCFLVQKCEEEEGVVGGGDEEEDPGRDSGRRGHLTGEYPGKDGDWSRPRQSAARSDIFEYTFAEY